MHRLAVLLAALTGLLCAKNVTNPYQSCPLEPMQFASEGSFYVWNTTGRLPNASALSSFSVHRIYVRYFDVVNGDGPEPAGIRHDVATDLEVIPVVYITVPALEGLSETQVSTLAQNIVRLIGKIGFSGNEIQLDCDWTAGTKTAFFSLIQKLRKLSAREYGRPILISATIRLHQIKYFRSTGIPPADRGMLMMYNMGKLADPAETNSIFRMDTARRYLNRNTLEYPLPLDVALADFSWGIAFLHGSFHRILNDLELEELKATAISDAPNWYSLERKANLAGYLLPAGTRIRWESVGPCDRAQALSLLSKSLPAMEDRRIAIFDYDSVKSKPHQELIDLFHASGAHCSHDSCSD